MRITMQVTQDELDEMGISCDADDATIVRAVIEGGGFDNASPTGTVNDIHLAIML